MPRFHVAVQGRPEHASPGGAVEVQGQTLKTLNVGAGSSPVPLPVTFEQAEAALLRLPRLYFEPDGSFGWFAEPGTPRWEIGGMLYDRGDRVMYAELNGACPAAPFRQLLAALGSADAPLTIQFLEQAAFVEPEEFCRWLERSE